MPATISRTPSVQSLPGQQGTPRNTNSSSRSPEADYAETPRRPISESSPDDDDYGIDPQELQQLKDDLGARYVCPWSCWHDGADDSSCSMSICCTATAWLSKPTGTTERHGSHVMVWHWQLCRSHRTVLLKCALFIVSVHLQQRMQQPAAVYVFQLSCN